MALAEYQQLVDNLVRDSASVTTPADRDQAIALAVLRYSMDAERTLTEDVTWAAAGYFGPLPTGWTTGSYLLGAEYPVGEQPASEIDLAVYGAPSGQQLVHSETLPLGAVVRVKFAADHVLTNAVDTVPAKHREALASYAAHMLCKQLATHFSGERDSTIAADGSNTDTRARNYAQRAKDYRAAYFAGLGMVDPAGGGSGNSAAGLTTPAASVSSWKGRGRFPMISNDVLGGTL